MTGIHSVSFDILLTNGDGRAFEIYIGGGNLDDSGNSIGTGFWGRCCNAFEIVQGKQVLSADGGTGLQANHGVVGGPGTLRIGPDFAPAVFQDNVWHNLDIRADLDNDVGAVLFDGNLVLGPYPIHPYGGISTLTFGHGGHQQTDNVHIDNLRMSPADAVPEPATMALLGGLLVCLARGRRS